MLYAMFLEILDHPLSLLNLTVHLLGLMIGFKRRTATPDISRVAIPIFSLGLFSWLMGMIYRAWVFTSQMTSKPVITQISPKMTYHAPEPGLFERITIVGRYVGYVDQAIWFLVWGLIIYALYFMKRNSEAAKANA